MTRRRRGFTLLEAAVSALLVAIAAVGINHMFISGSRQTDQSAQYATAMGDAMAGVARITDDLGRIVVRPAKVGSVKPYLLSDDRSGISFWRIEEASEGSSGEVAFQASTVRYELAKVESGKGNFALMRNGKAVPGVVVAGLRFDETFEGPRCIMRVSLTALSKDLPREGHGGEKLPYPPKEFTATSVVSIPLAERAGEPPSTPAPTSPTGPAGPSPAGPTGPSGPVSPNPADPGPAGPAAPANPLPPGVPEDGPDTVWDQPGIEDKVKIDGPLEEPTSVGPPAENPPEEPPSGPGSDGPGEDGESPPGESNIPEDLKKPIDELVDQAKKLNRSYIGGWIICAIYTNGQLMNKNKWDWHVEMGGKTDAEIADQFAAHIKRFTNAHELVLQRFLQDLEKDFGIKIPPELKQ